MLYPLPPVHLWFSKFVELVQPREAVAKEGIDALDLPGEPHVGVEGRHRRRDQVRGRQL